MPQDLFAKTATDPRAAFIREVQAEGSLPYGRTIEGRGGPVVDMDGTAQIMLGSSNYLGLSGDPRVTRAAVEALETYGTAVNGSRLMNGTTPLHLALERETAEWTGEEAALVFASGYDANVGCLSALLGPEDTVVCDAGDHASIFDGAAMSGARMLPFQHNRADRLEAMLTHAERRAGGALVVVDGIYSMSGDVARISELADVCARHGARLMVDEAHAVGVLGTSGVGTCQALGVENRVDLRMGTFSKAFAASGGFVAGPASVIDFLRVQSRSFIFTAATPPASIAAALESLRIIRSDEGRARSQRLRDNVLRLRHALTDMGFPVREPVRTHAGTEPVTPIIAIPVGDDDLAVAMWRSLYAAGVYVNAAIHPAVPRGRAQLRVSMTAGLERRHLDHAVDAFAKLRSDFPTSASSARM